MIYIIGGIIIIIGLIQLFRLFRNSKRPKLDATIEKIEDRHLDQDKNNQFKQQPHADIIYYHAGKKYTGNILLKDRNSSILDQIEVTFIPNSKNENDEPTSLEMYSPKKELGTALAIILIGCIVVGICHFIMTYFDLW